MNYDIADPALAGEGHRRIAWADRRMPVLASIRERFEAERPLEGIRVAACMHVTTETAVLMKTLRAGGAEVVALCIESAVDPGRCRRGARRRRYPRLCQCARRTAETFYRHINAILDTEPHIVFDDGADTTTVLHRERTTQPILGGLEETTTGCASPQGDGRRRRTAVSRWSPSTTPRRSISSTTGTGPDSPRSTASCEHPTSSLPGRTVVVAGFGDCGWGIARRAAGLGANVVVIEVDPIRALSAAMEGYRVMTAAESAPVGDVFLTATGDIHIFRPEHFAVMKDNVILANAGHFDVELDLTGLDAMAVGRREIRDNLEEYELGDGRQDHCGGRGSAS